MEVEEKEGGVVEEVEEVKEVEKEKKKVMLMKKK